MTPSPARVARAQDAAAVAALAARTFPLACPPSLPREHIAAFIAQHLGAAEFAAHIADPDHRVWVVDGAPGPDGTVRPVGYALVLHGDFAEGPESLRGAPSSYLSKLYVDPDHHGAGVARTLLDAAALDAGREPLWLGVNNDNARAKRFYAKSGFVVAGTRTFTVGETTFVDDVLVLAAEAARGA
ncbi:GNAT family N-acetyltransferase [Tsukamurella spumae]|uniref:GNAT family N-acetyltransferase n=1 Tax=Tsukamurella spumae TaxID=44753 RepID=A0A846X362_9ACTN|nr:GNAT family N-acetyltransferase [Tsukamurella spumae]NKY19794.1 GNAT family N-acetyltransferase [Tsukamurella spumae]